jgi:hypothetical protein
MDALLNIALAGTARGGNGPPSAGTPADELAARLPALGAERRLLLMAGARAIYRQAGGAAQQGIVAPEPAPAERLPACSPGAAQLIAAMLDGTQADLLPEALERLRLAGQRLPATLLPAALAAGTRTKDLRPLLLPALGERGRWLARQNPGWQWTAQVMLDIADDSGVPDLADAETTWQEGSPGERLTVLKQVRRVDPARGREWLEAVWRGEKADFRAEAIQVLAHGLSPNDEPFLEAALADRGQAVRAQATTLLARLPDSALTARMRERADAVLAYTPPPPAGRLQSLFRSAVGKAAPTGQLTVSLPVKLEDSWQRDGIAARPPSQVGERAWWLIGVLERVPPAHWTARFAAPPADLIAAALENEWGRAVIEGWSRAAGAAQDAEWVRALWPYWIDGGSRDNRWRAVAQDLRQQLILCIPANEVDQLAESLLTDKAGAVGLLWVGVAAILPTPWSVPVGLRYLEAVRQHLRASQFQSYDPWEGTLAIAARALPAACFEAALREWKLPELASWQVAAWRRELDKFTEAIRTRQRLQRLMEEIPQ